MPKRKSNAPFGLGSFSSVDSLNDGVSGFNKRNTLGMNKMRGAMAEDSFAMGQRIQGHEVTRIHKGGDFVVQKRDFFGNKVGKLTVHEIKTGNSQLSEAQRRKKARLGNRRYKVERY